MRSRFRFWLVLVALLVLLAVVWIDVATHFWQDLTVLAGVISGLVTFALTVLVIERVLIQSTHRRWAPVTRVALGDLLKSLVEESSELSHGMVMPRHLPPFSMDEDVDKLREVASQLGREAERERNLLAKTLARWSAYLAATAEVTGTLTRTAKLIEQLDEVHDSCVDLLRGLAANEKGKSVSIERLGAHLAAERLAYNEQLELLVERLLADWRETFRELKEVDDEEGDDD